MHGKIVFDIRNNVIARLNEVRKLQLKVAIPYYFVKHALFRHNVALVFGDKWPALADFYIIPYFRLAPIQHGQGIDLFLKCHLNGFAYRKLREVTQDIEIIKRNFLCEQAVFDEFFDLAVEDIISAY